MLVTVKGLSYSVDRRRADKLQVLTDVSAHFVPGQMAALMGPSGSGKTSLLDILAGRKTVGTIEGKVHYGGQLPSAAFLRRYTGVVEQFDTLIPSLTVEEMLMYTCEMKSPVSEALAAKRQRVDAVIHSLALDRCRGTRIGGVMQRGISGGEAKRANIGLALVASPRVLLLDEPTSGLDSYTANEVMRVVKSLASSGITILATIHSPSQYTFSLFDRLLIIVRGRTVYFGDNHSAMDFFITHYAPVNQDPDVSAAEWLTDTIVAADRKGRAGGFADTYAASPLKAQNEAAMDAQEELASMNMSADQLMVMRSKCSTETPAWFALKTMLKYRTRRDMRDPAYLGPRIADKLLVAIIILTLYWNVGDSFDSENLPNQSAMLFMLALLPGFSAVAYVPAIILDRPLFVRERSDGLYRAGTYLAFKMFGELALGALVALAVALMVYFATQLAGSWLLFFLTYYFTMATGIAVAYFISSISPNMDVANAAVPAYVITLLFFAGQLMRWDDIPEYWRWYAYLDFIRYGWGALMINQFGEQPEALYIGGITILEYYSLDTYNKWAFLGYLSCFFVAFLMATWGALAWKKHGSR